MCGIIITKDIKKAVAYTKLLDHRGTDGFGYVMEDVGNYFHNKARTLKVLGTSINNHLKGAKTPVDTIIMHNRAASVGGVSLELTHPISISGGFIIHNGTNRQVFNERDDIKLKSDTQVIGKLLAEADDVLEYREYLKGSGNIFEYIGGRFFVQIDGERPLFINKNRTIIASEPILKGKWQLIKTSYGFWEDTLDFINNCELDYEEVEAVGTEISSYCYSCGKTHLSLNYTTDCFSCVAKGNKGFDDNYYDYLHGWGRLTPTTSDVDVTVNNIKKKGQFDIPLKNGKICEGMLVNKDGRQFTITDIWKETIDGECGVVLKRGVDDFEYFNVGAQEDAKIYSPTLVKNTPYSFVMGSTTVMATYYSTQSDGCFSTSAGVFDMAVDPKHYKTSSNGTGFIKVKGY